VTWSILPIHFCLLYYRSLSTKISYSLVKGSSSGHKPIVLSHGALGNKNNFNTIAKRLNKSIGCSVCILPLFILCVC